MNVWAFLHNPDTFESAAYTVSLHFTKEGAEKAMTIHREFEKKEHTEMFKDNPEHAKKYPYDWSKHWFVQEMEVKN